MIYGNVNNEFFEQQAAILPKPLADALTQSGDEKLCELANYILEQNF